MAISIITHAFAHAGTNPTTPAFDSTGGTGIYVTISQDLSSGGSTPTDNKGNIYVGKTPQDNATNVERNRIFYCENPTVGTGHTVTGPGSISATVCVLVVSGSKTSASFDTENGATADGVFTLQTGLVSPSEDNCIAICSIVFQGPNLTINSGFTITDSAPSDANGYAGAMAYLIQTTAGAVNPAWTWDTFSENVAVTIAVFKAAGAGPTLWAQTLT